MELLLSYLLGSGCIVGGTYKTLYITDYTRLLDDDIQAEEIVFIGEQATSTSYTSNTVFSSTYPCLISISFAFNTGPDTKLLIIHLFIIIALLHFIFVI